MVVAALLRVLGIERELITQEYLWSEGDVKRAWIEQALDGIRKPEAYFQGVDLAALREKMLLIR